MKTPPGPRRWASVAFSLSAFLAPVHADTVFNFFSGGANGLFQEVNGTVAGIPTGLATNDFPALSLDGRFISIAAPDPAQPAQTSTDLFVWDRATQTRRRIVNYTTETLQDGSNATSNPSFSAISPSNSLVAMVTNLWITTNLQGTSRTPRVTMHRFSDGSETDLVEIGQGDAFDFFRSEFTGISWEANGAFFATPAYVVTPTQTGGSAATVGIVAYSFNGSKWVRSGQLTQPRIFDAGFPIVIETHVYPAISPNGQRLGFFLLTWPDAGLQGPVQARLMVQNINGSGLQELVLFNPGLYPLGLTWSTDGSQLIFSVGNQGVEGALHVPKGDPASAVIRTVNANGGTPGQLAGINGGLFPNQPRFGAPAVDLSQVRLRLDPASGGGFVLSAPGLDPAATYRLESGGTPADFDNSQNFIGQQVMGGISIPKTANARFFRLADVP